jgi:hypothetical protein
MHSYFIAAHVGAWLPPDSEGDGASTEASPVTFQVVRPEQCFDDNWLVLATRSWLGSILKRGAVTPKVRTTLQFRHGAAI